MAELIAEVLNAATVLLMVVALYLGWQLHLDSKRFNELMEKRKERP